MTKFIFFKNIQPEKEFEFFKKKPASYWQKKGEKMVLGLFNFTSKNVKAYKDFLNKNNLTKEIKSYKDFRSYVPLINKENYLRKYDYKDLFPKGSFYLAQTFASTSGSSGEPFFFPRGDEHDWQYEYIGEMILKNNFQVENKKTLMILSFGLGIWIGGMFSYKVFELISSRGYDLSIVPMGPNKDGILRVMKKFGHYYDQIILCGYPPFIKDLLDESENISFDWHKYNIKLFTAAEGIPADFQKYLIRKLGIKNPLTDITNIYGTVELGTMAYETPFSNLLKDILRRDKKLLKNIFGKEEEVLTLAQYYPHHLHMESIKGEIHVSGFGSSIPLIRYRFPDRGLVFGFDEMVNLFRKEGVDLIKEAKNAGVYNTLQKIPFVALYGRGDLSVSFVGIIIYPEYIKSAFFDKVISKYITSKFSLEVIFDKNLNQQLVVNVELRKGFKKNNSIKDKLINLILFQLLKNCTEYNYLYNNGKEDYKKRILPKVVLCNYADPKYFGIGTKQKWVIK